VKSDLKPKGIGLDGESVTWFQKMYPKTKTFEWRSIQKKPPPLDVVQNAGEIMYVPDGWWHAVLNLTHTVAVTQVRPWAFPKIPTNTVCQYKTDTFFYLS
jgi:histone arginine demethylase JMJD6